MPPAGIAATITITSNADGVSVDGTVTLREAFQSFNIAADFNADVAAHRSGTYGTNDTLRFAIGSGAQTISLTSALPVMLKPVTIDGTSQPGFNNASLIALDGTSAGAVASGLVFAEHTGSSAVSLNVTHFGRDGVWISSDIFVDSFDHPLPADLQSRQMTSKAALISSLQYATQTRSPPETNARADVAATASAISMTNLTISGNRGVGVRANGALNMTNVQVSTNGGDGIWVDTSAPISLSNCEIDANGRNGVRVLRESDAAGFALTGNSSVHDNASNGIMLGDAIAQTGAVYALLVDSSVFANQIGVSAQQTDAVLEPTTSSIVHMSIHGNRGAGLYFRSTPLVDVSIGGTSNAGFSKNDVEHNGFPAGDSMCQVGETAAQIIFDGPVSAVPDVCATKDVGSGACAADSQDHCLVNPEANNGAGSCATAYWLLGGTFDACIQNTTNVITGYAGDSSGQRGSSVVGIQAINGAWVNAAVNTWKHSNPLTNIDVASDVSSFMSTVSACPGQNQCLQ